MDVKSSELSPQLKALKTTDLSSMIRMSNLMVPRMISVFLPNLDEKQRNAFNKAMPVGGGKKFYIHLVGTPTPPIVIEMAQPLKMDVMSVTDVEKQNIKGLRMTIDVVQAAMEKRMGKVVWSLLGQLGALLSLSGSFMPILTLGPKEIKDLQARAMKHFKPLLDMMPQ